MSAFRITKGIQRQARYASTAAKQATLRSLIDLYHASATYPSANNFQEAVDTELLGYTLAELPKPINWSDLQTNSVAKEQSANEIARSASLQLNEAMAKQTIEDLGKFTHSDAQGTKVEANKRLQKHRLLKIMDALHGTSAGTNAGLEAVQEATKST